jgi:NAD(P)-dependent dehydrogenase (short-subunit alcohol dehydrogenase family)
MSYAGKVALITGGASGIGAAIGKALAEGGAQVVLADRQVDVAERVAAELGTNPAIAMEVDVRDFASVQRLAESTVERLGRIDYFFNNAGIAVGGEMDTYTPRDWDDVFDVNLRGVAYGIQAVYPVMIRQRSGHIINTASMGGLVPSPGAGAYCATKHAVVGLSKALRIEAARHGVRVSVLCPGVIRTPILLGGVYGRTNLDLSAERIEALWRRTRPMEVDEFAAKVVAAVARDQAIIIEPRWWKALWYLERLAPGLSMRLWSRLLGQFRAEVERGG